MFHHHWSRNTLNWMHLIEMFLKRCKTKFKKNIFKQISYNKIYRLLCIHVFWFQTASVPIGIKMLDSLIVALRWRYRFRIFWLLNLVVFFTFCLPSLTKIFEMVPNTEHWIRKYELLYSVDDWRCRYYNNIFFFYWAFMPLHFPCLSQYHEYRVGVFWVGRIINIL